MTPKAANLPSPANGRDGYTRVDHHGYVMLKSIEAHGIRALLCGRKRETGKTPLHIVIVFRGTASVRNALTDARISRRVFDEMAEDTKKGATIHNGFASAWHDLRPLIHEHLPRVVERYQAIVGAEQSYYFLCTGHSLGGAVASLCAYSLVRGILSPHRNGRDVLCYTFGSPRVGNNLFASQYNKWVSETYRVVNENDRVASLGHCCRQHLGKLVRIDRDGNVVLEPCDLERLYDPTRGSGASLKNHLLDRYANSMDNALCPRNANLFPYVTSYLHSHFPVETPTRSPQLRPVSPTHPLQPSGFSEAPGA